MHYPGSDLGKGPQSGSATKRRDGYEMRVSPRRRIQGELGAKKMNLVAQISKPSCRPIESASVPPLLSNRLWASAIFMRPWP